MEHNCNDYSIKEYSTDRGIYYYVCSECGQFIEWEENKMKRPEGCLNEHLEFFDALRESGITNMFGAASYLTDEYVDLTKEQSRKILSYWMKTFGKDNR